MKNIQMKVVLLIALIINSITNAQTENEKAMKSKYQVIKISSDHSIRLPFVWDDNKYLLDLRELKPFISKETESGKVLLAYIDKLTTQGKTAFILSDSIERDNRVYYSHYWTRKNSLVKIIDYKSLGSESHTNEYLGPLALIPTDRYGIATYQLKYDDEKIVIDGPAYKKFWSLRKHYWSNAQVYLPLEPKANEKMVLVEIGLPTGSMNHLNYHGLYAVIPQTF